MWYKLICDTQWWVYRKKIKESRCNLWQNCLSRPHHMDEPPCLNPASLWVDNWILPWRIKTTTSNVDKPSGEEVQQFYKYCLIVLSAQFGHIFHFNIANSCLCSLAILHAGVFLQFGFQVWSTARKEIIVCCSYFMGM